MGLLGGWFRKNQPDDYEQVLAALSHDIHKRQTHLSEIRLRERRTTLLFSLYALGSWIAYVSLWYTGYVPSLSGRPRGSGVEKFAEALPVFVGPILILFIRRIVQIWYTRQGDKEEKHLVTLRKQQREKIEEIKKKTNYYSTRTLIERYDDSSNCGVDSPLRRRSVPGNVNGGPATPQRMPQQQPIPQQQPQMTISPQTPVNSQGQKIPPGLQQQLSPSPQRPIPPPRKQWYDRLADAILGDEDVSTPGAVASRYALICQKCFTHNGLVKENAWETTQYICRNCGQFNPSPQAARHSRSSSTSRPSVSPSRPESELAPPLSQAVGEPSARSPRQRKISGSSVGNDSPIVSMDVDGDA